jgi:hypothetical protein
MKEISLGLKLQDKICSEGVYFGTKVTYGCEKREYGSRYSGKVGK